jgi:hypothetical protein
MQRSRAAIVLEVLTAAGGGRARAVRAIPAQLANDGRRPGRLGRTKTI